MNSAEAVEKAMKDANALDFKLITVGLYGSNYWVVRAEVVHRDTPHLRRIEDIVVEDVGIEQHPEPCFQSRFA